MIIFTKNLIFFKKTFFLFFIIFCCDKIYSQEEGSKLIGIVENESSNKVMSGVHVINTSKVIGVITNNEGVFELEVSQNYLQENLKAPKMILEICLTK